jgi:polysaccharide export outer membrane protein
MKSTLLFFGSTLVIFLLASCTTQKNINYLSSYPRDSSYTYIYQGFEVPIQVGDELAVTVTALNPASAIPYTLPKGITVDQDGKILYPQLGAIKVEGLTRSQFRDMMITRLKTYLTDPVVTVDFLNFKVTVLGEVAKPGTITLPQGRINILEALAQAGDLTVYGKKTPVMVIRENKGRREFGYVNLLSNSIFTSPYYRLQQNDIVFVQGVENKPTVEQEVNARKLSYTTSVLAIVSTIGLLVLNIFNNR